ncbi:YrzE family protein [Streptomyces sp. NPDC097941]|uniref:YrzE family protein n=1 Tax=Streptomyces sp. NPDC097941 TaxID=3155685 RepID=UPI00331D41AF
MFRPDRATLRSTGFVVLLTGVFVLVNSQVVYAASSSSETGDLLAPLNIDSSEGVPINGYELGADGGSIVSFKTQSLAFALSGLFTLIRLLVGLAGWSIEVTLRFPLLKILTTPAQKVADAYNNVVVDALGIKGLLLAWAFVFAGFMMVRGRVGRGLGEIFLTLLIAAFAASTFVRPDYLLAENGPLGQTQQVAAEVAQESVNSYDWGGKIASTDPCAGMAGNAEIKCLEREEEAPVSAADVARPLQDSITNALIVKPFMLLEYGRILDPAKKSDREAYAVHLKWVAGGYKAYTSDDGDGGADCSLIAPPARKYCEEQNAKQKKAKDACSLVHGPAKEFCERDKEEAGNHCALLDGQARKVCESDGLPGLTPGGDLLDSASAIVSEEDQEFAAFMADMKKAGDVGKSCAAYAEQPTWWRVGGAFLLLIAALFICGMLLSSAIVLLGTQGVCAGAAAVGGVTFIAGMLPGPARQSVWKWLSLWGIACLAVVGICAFIPFFGIAIDATITNGPDLMVERILLIDVLAIAGAAGHRRLLTGITSFGRRMAMRMRYAKVGGTHMPGDTSELGAALAMNSPAAMGGFGGGLRAFTGGGGGQYGMLGTRQRLMGALASLVDGAGLPVDTGGVLAAATAEAGRGLAPLTAAAAVGGLGARLSAKGAHWLLIGKRPDKEQLAKWRKPTADGDPNTGGNPSDGGDGPGGTGPRRPGGPPDRYRNEQGQVVDRNSGQVLHDQNTDRTLLSTRAHNRLVRFRGYRILNRGGRTAYGATVGLPANVRRARSGGSRYSQDARQQVRVWGHTVREDGRAWADTGRHVSRVLREHTDDSGGPGPFVSRRLPTRPAPAPRPIGSSGSPARTRPASPRARAPAPATAAAAGPRPSAPPTSPTRIASGGPRRPAGPAPARSGPVFPGGGGARSAARDEARARFQELMRRTAPDAERLRQERARQPEDGEDE